MMNTLQERLSRLDHALLNKENICSSEGMLHAFPAALKEPFHMNGVGSVSYTHLTLPTNREV